MKQLIKIQNTTDGTQRVSARDLYIRLGYADRQFARWSKKHIITNPYAVEGNDWIGFDVYVEGNAVPEYMLSVDFAKKLCMLSKTVTGEKIRNYFLEVEKVAMQTVAPQLTDNRKLLEYEDRLRRLEASTAVPDVSVFTIFGYATYSKKPLYGSELTTLGKRASKLCRELGLPIGQIRDSRFGVVNTYPETVLYNIFSEFLKQPRF